MIKQRSILEVKIGERLYELHCGNDSPLGELHDALLQMKGYVVDKLLSAQNEEQATTDFVNGKTDVPPMEEVKSQVEEVTKEE